MPETGQSIAIDRHIGLNLNGTVAQQFRQQLLQYPNIDDMVADLMTAAYVVVHELQHEIIKDMGGMNAALSSEGEAASSADRLMIDTDAFIQAAKTMLGVN